MRGFSGFSEVRRELQQGFRKQLVNLAIEVDGFSFLASREYVTGRDLATGRVVRASLADRRTYEGRPTLADRREQLGEGGILVLTDAWMNRNGIFEAFNALPFPAGSVVLTDGTARISAPVQRDSGTWSQSIQHLRTERAVACNAYHDVVDAALSAMAEPGPGRGGAVVRGWHAAQGGAMSFEIGSLFDPVARDYLSPEASFDAFLAAPDVYVSGLNTSASGERCMEILSRLMTGHPGEIVWEVIPKRTYSMGGIVAEAAGLGTRRDASAPYRTGDRPRATGCLPSVIAFVERDGVLWPRIAAPLRGDGIPIPALYVATVNAAPEPPAPRPAQDASSRRGRDRFADARAARAAGAAPGRMRTGFVRLAPAADPLSAPDAPEPLPPDLAFPSEGDDMPDLSAFDGIQHEDVAALSRLDDLAVELKGLSAA